MPKTHVTPERPAGHEIALRASSNDSPIVRTYKQYTESKAIDDPFKGAYGISQGSWQAIFEPPFSFYALMRMPQDNSTLSQCIDAMVTNVDGHGYRLEYVANEEEEIDEDGNPVAGEASPAAVAEKKVLEDLLNYPNDDYTFQELRDRVRRDYETIGNAFIEIGRDALGRVVMMSHVPAHTVRLTNREVNPVEIEITLPRDGGKEMKRKVHKRFRRYVQMVGNKRVYFKEYGDPRFIDPTNGEEMKGATGKSALAASATELIHFAQYNPSSPYGLPRWFNQMRNLLGQSQAEMVNLDFFKDNAIPAMMLLVAGGAVTQASIDELQQSFNSMRGRGSMQRVMIVEATGDQNAADNEGRIPPPKIMLEPLMKDRQDDGNFLKYDDSVRNKIQSAFRIPPLFLGLSSDHTRATAQSSYEVAEGQVFGPERQRLDDIINRKILGTYQPRYWQFKSNRPQLSSQEELITALATFDAAGALTPNVAIGIANELYGLNIAAVEEDWGNYPFAMSVQLLTANKLKVDLQNVEDPAPPAPGQMEPNGNPVTDPNKLTNQTHEPPETNAPQPSQPEKPNLPTPTDTNSKPVKSKPTSKAERQRLLTEETTKAMLDLHARLRAIREEE